jgi:hypothetical protein
MYRYIYVYLDRYRDIYNDINIIYINISADGKLDCERECVYIWRYMDSGAGADHGYELEVRIHIYICTFICTIIIISIS